MKINNRRIKKERRDAKITKYPKNIATVRRKKADKPYV